VELFSKSLRITGKSRIECKSVSRGSQTDVFPENAPSQYVFVFFKCHNFCRLLKINDWSVTNLIDLKISVNRKTVVNFIMDFLPFFNASFMSMR